jgi:hypothetical protein
LEVDTNIPLRFPTIHCPIRINFHDEIPVEISIRIHQNNVSPLHFLPGTKSTNSILVIVTIDQDKFDIVLPAERFDQIILVPIEEKDSDPVLFRLKAKETGSQKIFINFYQNGVFLERREKIIDVSPGNSKGSISPAQKIYPIRRAVLNIRTELLPAPSITMHVNKEKVLILKSATASNLPSSLEEASSNLNYKIMLEVSIAEISRIMNVPIDESLTFQESPASEFKSFFDRIEFYASSPEKVHKLINEKGESYFNTLFSGSLNSLYFKLENHIDSIRVFTDEPWVPWELVRPCSTGNPSKYFLCEKYSLSRGIKTKPIDVPFLDSSNTVWQSDGEPSRDKSYNTIAIVIPKDIDRVQLLDELNWIKNFCGKIGMRIIPISGLGELQAALKAGGFDILHISTHNTFDYDSPGDSSFALENNEFFKLDQLLQKEFSEFGNNNPLVVMNACESAKHDFSMTSIQGWAEAFISCQAIAFIGTIWKVHADIALKFSQGLYTRLAENIPLGEAVKEARKSCIHQCTSKCKQDCNLKEDPSWLSYQLYGHPYETINLEKYKDQTR